MMLRVSPGAFRVSLLGALGLVAGAACGGGDERSVTCTIVTAGDVAAGDGFEVCQEGYYHRTEKLACTADLTPFACRGGGADSNCQTDVDCGGGQGHCLQRPGEDACRCEGGCSRDEDCGVGAICDCQRGLSPDSTPLLGQCVLSFDLSCTVDADCGLGSFCASYTQSGCGGRGFACLSPDDECRADSECPSDRPYCGYEDGRRVCLERDCNVGRPFRVEGENRLAPLASRADWSRLPQSLVGAADLPESLRTELGAYWAWLGQMEHASVAAFARFALQLLSLGAPPELVADAQAAMGDELEHARLCFGLAQSLARRPIGPGRLGLEGAFESASLAEVVRLAIVEGCVGETVAALEAAEACSRATEPAVVAVLEKVQVDEQRHAELAWRFVRWALETGGAEARAAASETFARALGEATAPVAQESAAASDEARALAFGRLPERLRSELRRRVLREVVGPCAERLLTATGGAEASVQGGALAAGV